MHTLVERAVHNFRLTFGPLRCLAHNKPCDPSLNDQLPVNSPIQQAIKTDKIIDAE